jgi:hypothetical protein
MTGQTSASLLLPPAVPEMEQLETHVESRLNRRVQQEGMFELSDELAAP